MATLVHPSSARQLRDSGPDAANRLVAAGELEVLRITGRQADGPDGLILQGRPARPGGRARSVRISFDLDAASLAPFFDTTTDRIQVYYPHREHAEVVAMLNRHLDRFCYFWRSAEGRTHAWLVGSPR